VRKGGRTRGPFPDGQVARDILLGRIRKQDEISIDGEHWQHPGTLPQLVPEVMKHADTEQGRQHLLLARLREDERLHERRHAAYAPVDSNRRHGDQRTVESFDLAAHHESEMRPEDKGEQEDRSFFLPAALIMTALFMLTAYILW